MSLTIGIDARELELDPRGVGRVLISLLTEWNKNTRGHRFVLYFKNALPDLEVLDHSHYEKKVLPIPRIIRRNRLWEQIFLPLHIKKDRLDVFFSPSYTLPVATDCPTVVAIHDISYRAYPEWFDLRQQILLRLFTRLSVGVATQIVCCSNFTRSELLTYYGASLEAKTSTVYYAPDERFRSKSSAIDDVLERYHIAQPYFLFVGSLLRRRNIPHLIRAFQKTAQTRYRLVLIGNNNEMGDELQQLTDRLGVQESVIHIEYVKEDDLAAIYRGAFCFVHPSSYEGFALPIVEAMASGTPVIIADAGAMVEVAAGAAGVSSLENLPQTMTALIENPVLREDLIQKGLERIQKLSWRDTAAAFMDIIEKAAKRL